LEANNIQITSSDIPKPNKNAISGDDLNDMLHDTFDKKKYADK